MPSRQTMTEANQVFVHDGHNDDAGLFNATLRAFVLEILTLPWFLKWQRFPFISYPNWWTRLSIFRPTLYEGIFLRFILGPLKVAFHFLIHCLDTSQDVTVSQNTRTAQMPSGVMVMVNWLLPLRGLSLFLISSQKYLIFYSSEVFNNKIKRSILIVNVRVIVHTLVTLWLTVLTNIAKWNTRRQTNDLGNRPGARISFF